MDQQTKEIMESEVQQKIVAAIQRAAREGQPVKAIYEAVSAGQKLYIWVEEGPEEQCVLVISTAEKEEQT